MGIRTRYAALATVFVLGAIGCGSSVPPAPSTTFCDIATIVGKHCSTCHASEPQFGAPMSLMHAADWMKPSLSNSQVPVWSAVQTRIHDVAHPMPSNEKLSTDDLAALDKWLSSSHAIGSCSDVPPEAHFTGKEGVESLPCTPDVFVAATKQPSDGTTHVTQGWPVAVQTDSYVCFGVRLPAKKGRQLTAVAPMIGDSRLVHHMILYREKSSNALPPGGHSCKLRSYDAVPIILWGPGAGGLVLPGDVGLDLGDDEVQFDLEVHYNNGRKLEDVADTSGFGACTTTETRPVHAQVGTVGTLFFTIPPKTGDTDGTLSLTNVCTPPIDKPTHIIASAPHMHALGRAMKTDILRANGKVDTLIDVPNYDFSDQSAHPVDFVLNEGDQIQTTCRWSNPNPDPVVYGGTTANEMCFNFLLYYPAGQLAVNGFPAQACIDAAEVTSHK